MSGGNMANQFDHSALPYANPQTAAQSLGVEAAASAADIFDTLEQFLLFAESEVPQYDEMPYGAAVSYEGIEAGTEPLPNTNQFKHRAEWLESYRKEIEWYPIPGAIQGDNIPNSITDRTDMGLQPVKSSLSIEDAELIFFKLIKLPLKEFITDPEKESSMKNALSVLADNFTRFPPEMGEKFVELSIEFAVFVPNGRGYNYQSQKYSQQFSAEKENISGQNELRVRYEELEKKEKELITELEAVKKEKAEIDKQIKEKEQLIMNIATEKLANLSNEWARFQSFFN